MNSGLSENDYRLLRSTLKQFHQVTQAFVFGSRAKGNFKANSDVDLAVSGQLSGLDLERLAEDLNDLPLPYKFDVVCLESIQNESLMDHILRVGIRIYP